MGAAIDQIQSKWTAHGKIARLEYALAHETHDDRRTWLESLLKKQREIFASYEA
jgi:hypothetical protein